MKNIFCPLTKLRSTVCEVQKETVQWKRYTRNNFHCACVRVLFFEKVTISKLKIDLPIFPSHVQLDTTALNFCVFTVNKHSRDQQINYVLLFFILHKQTWYIVTQTWYLQKLSFIFNSPFFILYLTSFNYFSLSFFSFFSS